MRSAVSNIGLTALVALSVFAAMLAVPGCSGTKPTKDQLIERYSQQLRAAITTGVPQEQRRAQMLVIVERLEALQSRFSRETAAFVDSYRRLNADYDSTRPAFDLLFSDFSAKRLEARHEALELHYQLASLASASEWSAIGSAEIDLYEEVNAVRPASASTTP